MNRRNRKKTQPSLFDDLINRLKGVGTGETSGDNLLFWNRLPRFHQRALMVLILLQLVLLVIPMPEPTLEVAPVAPQRVEVNVNTTGLSQQREVAPGPRTETVMENKRPTVKKGMWQEYEVKSGDTLAKVFRTNQLSLADLNALVKIEGLDKPLSKIKQGQLVRYKTDCGRKPGYSAAGER